MTAVSLGARIASVIVLACLMSVVAVAQTTEVSYTASGRGVTLSEAIEQALFEVARQAGGTQIQATQASSVKTVSGSVTGPDGDSAGFQFEERSNSNIRTSASGLVSAYQIISQRDTGRGFEVQIRATVPRYRVPGIDSENRRKLAVIPFATRLGRVEFFGSHHGDELASELSQAVLGQFVQSRRFAVLDRESWGAIGQERALLASSATPISEKAKLGIALGADYLVLGELLEADAGVKHATQRLTGVHTQETIASISIAYRIVVPATGEIKFADTLDIRATDKDGRPIASRAAALNELSRRMVGIALDRIYPIKVVNVVSPDAVVLNQGGSTLAVGDQLRLMEEGAAMIDPYTKEPLGRVETSIGTLEITRVDGKVAYASLVGTPVTLRVGLTARRDADLRAAAQRAALPPPTPRTDGVRLPFDR